MMQKLMVLIFLGFGYTSYADVHAKADSMMGLLKKDRQEDTLRLQRLDDVAQYYAEMGKLDSARLLLNAANDLGDKIMAHAKDLATIKKILGIKASNYISLGEILPSGNSEQYRFFNKSLKLYEQLGDKKGICDANTQLQSFFSVIGYPLKALDYGRANLKLAIEIKDTNTILNSFNANLENCVDLEKYDKAVELAWQELAYRKDTNRTYALLAGYYSKNKQCDSARLYASRVRIIPTSAVGEFMTAMQYREAGAALVKCGDTAAGIFNIHDALLVYRKYKARLYAGLCCQQLSDIYFNTARTDTAEQYGQQALDEYAYLKNNKMEMVEFDTGKSHGVMTISIDLNEAQAKLYQLLTDIYARKKDFKRSFEYESLYRILNDTIQKKRNDEEKAQLQQQYELNNEIAGQQLKEQETTREMQRQKYIRYGITSGLAILLLFLVVVFRQKQNIGKEKNRSDGLLLNILPAEVAEELKEKGSADAKLFENVTVMLTDFVGFTTASERLTPQELVDELHACFSAFDHIISKYGIEKIKTVGDAYLAVSGLPLANANHAESMVNAAMEIRDFMIGRRKLTGDKTFEIRIGLHSGHVVAGIVGVKKFAYDIWGDTVNTAARMEQNSEAGKVNISEATYQLVKDKFACEYRGDIEAKNKGRLKMYFVG